MTPAKLISLQGANRNKTPSPLLERASDLYHCNIVTLALSQQEQLVELHTASTLLMLKLASHTFIYPLKILTTDLVSQIQQFLIDVEGICNEFRTDFDQKLIGGKVKDYLLQEQMKVSAAPPRQQHNYQTILKVNRTFSLLPSNYWWLAMKRALEVSNLLPTLHTNSPTPITLHELFYKQKPDLRTQSMIPTPLN